MPQMNGQPIRVLQVIGSMNLGGAESMIMNLYRSIDKTKVQFDFLVHTQKEATFDNEIKALGGRIYRVPKLTGTNIIEYYRECCKFFSEHPEIKVLHGHIGSSAYFYVSAAKKYGVFTIVHSHSANIIKNPKDLAFSIFSYPTRFVADELFGCSTEAGIQRFGKKAVERENYRNFPNAIDIDKYKFNEETRKAVRKEFGIPDNCYLIGTVGRLIPEKNPPFIFEIFKRLASENDNVRCLWVGYGLEEPNIREKVKTAGLEKKIIMPGRRNDVNKLLQGMDAFVLPSITEGLPVAGIEAQAAGLPCIFSDSVSRESAICNLVNWKSIQESASNWASEALILAREYKGKRQTPTEDIKKHGYDIKTTSAWLTNYYLSKAKEND